MSAETMPSPTVGRIVHYVSYGTPAGEYPSACRAAVVTEVDDDHQTVGLAVLNPEGMFFNRHVPCRQPPMGGGAPGGSWHWPERAT